MSLFRRPRQPLKPLVMPYFGYGTASEVFLKGCVLSDNGISDAQDTDPIRVNFHNMVKRYARHSIAEARVRVSVGKLQQEVATNAKGYFDVHFQRELPDTFSSDWHDIAVELLDYPGLPAGAGPFPAVSGKVLIPSDQAQFGVISDVDDTVLRTDILNVVRMITNTFFHNAHTRLPFKGVAAFYTALHVGTQAEAINPIFYVSNSSWALYDVIVDFFLIRGIPTGPLFLSDLGIVENARHHNSKFEMVQRLLDTYPNLKFILCGDSGERDPEIYMEIVQKNPGRIRAIYIRDVTHRRRDRQIKMIIEQVKALGVEMLFIEDTEVASHHALAKGFILPEAVPEIKEERQKDEPPPLVTLTGDNQPDRQVPSG